MTAPLKEALGKAISRAGRLQPSGRLQSLLRSLNLKVISRDISSGLDDLECRLVVIVLKKMRKERVALVVYRLGPNAEPPCRALLRLPS